MSIAFSLNGRNVHPNYSDGISLQSKRQTGERFRRTELSEKLVFQGEDYDWIVAQAFDTKFILHMDTGTMTWDGVFWKTDCEFNADDRTCSVQPDPYDYYKAVLDGYEKDYDLVKLAPATFPIGMQRRNILQLYVMSNGVGDKVVTNVVGGTTWEQDITVSYTEVTNSKLVNDWHFAKQKEQQGYSIGGSQYPGFYEGDTNVQLGNSTIYFSGPNYDMGLWLEASGGGGQGLYLCSGMFTKLTPQLVPDTEHRQYIGPAENVFPPDYVTIGTDITATMATSAIYARLLCGEKITGYERSAEDIVEYNLNYLSAYPNIAHAYGGGYTAYEFVISTEVQNNPTPYGKNSDGKYFVRPTAYLGSEYIPFAKSSWLPYSLWIWAAEAIMTQGSDSYSLNDAYPIESCINILLGKITADSGKPVTFALADSLFLNGDSPLRTGRKLFISQLSNVKKTYYQNAAQTGKITLKQILDMLRDCFHCYWHIDSEGAMHIEHISWYMNGGTYSSDTRTPSADLTEMVHPRNFHTWDFGQNTYGFDKVSLPERIEMTFATSQTEPFNGNAIQYQSGYVKKGSIDRVTVSNFYSDVDWLISGASGTGDDGWVVLDALDNSGTYTSALVSLNLFGAQWNLQNGYMSFAYLETNFFGYDMSAPVAQYEGNYTMTCTDTVRARTQQVVFPCSSALSDFALVKTGVGTGEIDSVEYKIKSGSAQADLKLPTEDE